MAITPDTHRGFMEVAISMAEQCQPKDDKTTPRVGAVIAIGNEIIAASFRGEEDHAEKLALERVRNRDLHEATVYTTLEPCTKHVRREIMGSCTDRLIQARIRRVVIGILDPNQGVCGKGILQLQKANVEVELFPHDLAMRIYRSNEPFIRTQQGFGVQINHPRHGDRLQVGIHEIHGTLNRLPAADDVLIPIVRYGNMWWPEQRIVVAEDLTWTATFGVGIEGTSHIYIVRAEEAGRVILGYQGYIAAQASRQNEEYRKLGAVLAHLTKADPEQVYQALPRVQCHLDMMCLPKGLNQEACVTVEVAAGPALVLPTVPEEPAAPRPSGNLSPVVPENDGSRVKPRKSGSQRARRNSKRHATPESATAGMRKARPSASAGVTQGDLEGADSGQSGPGTTRKRRIPQQKGTTGSTTPPHSSAQPRSK